MKKQIFNGAATALVTPFKEDGSLDIGSLAELIEFQIENGIRGIVLSGTTGEGSTLSNEEFCLLIQKGAEFIHGRVPLIAGTGSNNTETAIRRSMDAESLGADALLIVTPYYNKTTQAGLIRHYQHILDAVDLPAILYNVPSRTGLAIEPETLRVLSDHPQITGIKEASGNISKTADFLASAPELPLYSGNDDQTLPTLSLGGCGVISVLSNIAPQEVQRICTLFEQGKTEKAAKLQLRLLPLVRALFGEVNPIPIKYAMKLQGFSVGNPRLPLVPCEEKTREIIQKAIIEAGI